MAERFHGKEEAASSNLAPSSMKSANKIILILIIFLLILFGFLYFTSNKESEEILDSKVENNIEQDYQDFVRNIKMQISDLSPEPAVLGGAWQVSRVWFALDDHAYVEYEDGHAMRRILVKQINDNDFEVLAFFEPGEDDWVLVSGEDTMFGQALDLY